jgi:GMP synthase-like glutamine amidotransferase
LRVLIIENFDNTGLGQVGSALEEAGAGIDLRRAQRGDPLPDTVNGHDAIVVLGGGQNALADDACPWFPALLDLIREFERQDRSVLGICLGGQLLARAFGAENHIGTASEFGWHRVDLTEAAKADAVLGLLPARFPIFQWHDDTFSLPERAMHLARNATAEHQAFRIGRATYGVQFHFEADRRLVRQWNQDFASSIGQWYPDWPARFESEEALHGPDADAAGLSIARAWVKTI